jgi:glucokinase
MPPLYASLDLGGTKIAGALATADGAIVARATAPTRAAEGPEAVVERMGQMIDRLAQEAGAAPVAVGIGVPGLADLASGEVRFLPNLPGNWRGVPVREMLNRHTPRPVYLLNDARMAALGELVFGYGRTCGNLAFLTLGTGIGGGFTIGGRLHLGRMGASAEFGHTTVLPDGPACGCGSRGCLETLAAGPAITGEGVRLLLSGQTTRLYELTGGDPGRVTPREMAQAAAEGDEAVRIVLVRAAEYLGIGIANIVSILHPELIVLGGSVAAIGPLLFDTVRSTIHRRVGMFPTDHIRVEASLLGDRAALLGGIALASQQGVEPISTQTNPFHLSKE